MGIKHKRCKVEEEEYSLWHLLPHDVLWMIIERLDLLDCDSVSAVCDNWRSGFKSYCTTIKKSFPLPKDTLPWLMTRKNRNSSVIKLYRLSINRTYKINMPEINGKDCLYSKDGWLLLHEFERQRKKYNDVKLCLINLFTMDKIELPELKTNKQILITKGVFSTQLNCPDCVIVMTGEINHGATLYAWKKGSCTWKERDDFYYFPTSETSNIWSCYGVVHCFNTYGEYFIFDTDLNMIQANVYKNLLHKLYTMTECGNELFVCFKDNVCEIDHSVMDFRKVDDVSSMILLKNADNIGFMVREECTKARSLLMNNLKNHGCQINPSTKRKCRTTVFENESYKLDGEMVYQYDRSTQNWVKFDFDNLVSFGEDMDIREWQKQMKAKEKLLVNKLIHGDKITTENPPFFVDRKKTGFWINVG